MSGARGRLALCRVLALPRVRDRRGNLTFIEGGREVPFPIKRVYYMDAVPGGAERGGHAHRALRQLIVALSGRFTVVLDDGRSRKRWRLSRPDRGLLVAPRVWRRIEDFSPGSVCLVLASERYDESDYFRDYEAFRASAAGA